MEVPEVDQAVLRLLEDAMAARAEERARLNGAEDTTALAFAAALEEQETMRIEIARLDLIYEDPGPGLVEGDDDGSGDPDQGLRPVRRDDV